MDGIKVLMVEDDKIIIEMMHLLFNQFEVDHICVSEDFYKVFQPDTLEGVTHAIIDMQLPGISGAEILEFLAEEVPHVKRIIFSGMADQLDKDVLRLAHSVVMKPSSIYRLLHEIGYVDDE